MKIDVEKVFGIQEKEKNPKWVKSAQQRPMAGPSIMNQSDQLPTCLIEIKMKKLVNC